MSNVMVFDRKRFDTKTMNKAIQNADFVVIMNEDKTAEVYKSRNPIYHGQTIGRDAVQVFVAEAVDYGSR